MPITYRDTISPNNLPYEADAVVYREGDYAVAKIRGRRGELSSTDHAKLIQEVIDHVYNNFFGSGVIYITSGKYIIKSRIDLRSNMTVINDGFITGDLLAPVFYGDNIENVKIIGRGWIRQSKVNIYGQANGNFNTTYQCIYIENSRNIEIDHEVGGFPTTSETDTRPRGPNWSVRLRNVEKAFVKVRGSYDLEHVLIENSRNVIVDVIGEKNYDSGVWILRSDNVHVKAIIDMTDVPCCANGVEVNTSRNVIVDAIVYNPPVHGVWLYFDPNANMDMYNIDIRATVIGGTGNGVYGVELGNPTNVYDIYIRAEVYNVGSRGIHLEGAGNVYIDAIIKNAGTNPSIPSYERVSFRYYRLQNARIRLISINPYVADLYDRARDTGEGPGLSSIKIIDFYSDKYEFNVYPQDIECPYRYTIFLKDYTVSAGSTVSLLPIHALSKKFFGRVSYVYVTNSNIYVQLYNVSAGVVQNEDNTTGVKNWAIWWLYDYELRLRNSDTVNSQTTDILIEIETLKPLE